MGKRKQRTKMGSDGKEKEAEGLERENWGGPDMKRKEDEVGARENCEGGRGERKKGVDHTWKD